MRDNKDTRTVTKEVVLGVFFVDIEQIFFLMATLTHLLLLVSICTP